MKRSLLTTILMLSLFSNAAFPAKEVQSSGFKAQTKTFFGKLKDTRVGNFCKNHKKKIIGVSGLIATIVGSVATFATTKYCICKFTMIPASTFSKPEISRSKTKAIQNLNDLGFQHMLVSDHGADGIVIWPKTCTSPDKLMVFLDGNCSVWQHTICSDGHTPAHLAKAACKTKNRLSLIEQSDCPVLLLNYAGVGDSKSFPYSFKHVVSKLTKEVARVEKTLSINKTVFSGHSIGGYLASEMASKRYAPFFSDRSLSTMSKTASEMTHIPRFLTSPFFKLMGWEHDASKAATNTYPIDFSFSREDPIIGHKASFHKGIVKNYPVHRVKTPCTDLGGHDLKPKDGFVVRDTHNVIFDHLECKHCGKSLVELISDFTKGQ